MNNRFFVMIQMDVIILPVSFPGNGGKEKIYKPAACFYTIL
ncbi:MAG: hypothetical protein BWY71_02188 [Planctomycetes bacterium ADurb.Bin412]|nr:MAG: hypothetical protein BWY71_02188 [Planctomycetes bacterium ADurb.Bin412]